LSFRRETQDTLSSIERRFISCMLNRSLASIRVTHTNLITWSMQVHQHSSRPQLYRYALVFLHRTLQFYSSYFPRTREGLSSIRWSWQGYCALSVAILGMHEQDLTHGLWTESIPPLRPSPAIRRTAIPSSALIHNACISINLESLRHCPEVPFWIPSWPLFASKHNTQSSMKARLTCGIRTLSPTVTLQEILLPSLSKPPGPTARTLASLSSLTLDSGRKMPDAVRVSALMRWTRTRSSRGARDLIDLSAVAYLSPC